MPLCIKSRKRASRGSTSYPPESTTLGVYRNNSMIITRNSVPFKGIEKSFLGNFEISWAIHLVVLPKMAKNVFSEFGVSL
ncbi:hypothetical protein T4B_1134 [Trichinella pseudospiralis]|uniref:Uncharacterized protein n=1 Tax=Trichinella pseudospiralis TaxID=6337 RepID=A0A0V1GPE2_TRIPS|nr:hypothetical protein T4B_1134 [Trichinella pseudospiralis]